MGSFRPVSEALAIRERWFAAGQPKGTAYRTIFSGSGPEYGKFTNLVGCQTNRISCSYCGGCQNRLCDPAAACDKTPGCYGFVADFSNGNHLTQAFLCTDRNLKTFEQSSTTSSWGPGHKYYTLVYAGRDSVREVNQGTNTWVAGPC